MAILIPDAPAEGDARITAEGLDHPPIDDKIGHLIIDMDQDKAEEHLLEKRFKTNQASVADYHRAILLQHKLEHLIACSQNYQYPPMAPTNEYSDRVTRLRDFIISAPEKFKRTLWPSRNGNQGISDDLLRSATPVQDYNSMKTCRLAAIMEILLWINQQFVDIADEPTLAPHYTLVCSAAWLVCQARNVDTDCVHPPQAQIVENDLWTITAQRRAIMEKPENLLLMRLVQSLEIEKKVNSGLLPPRHASTSCELCLSPCISAKDRNHQPTKLPCDHIFGTGCIYKYMSAEPRCPTCRADYKHPSGREPRTWADGKTITGFGSALKEFVHPAPKERLFVIGDTSGHLLARCIYSWMGYGEICPPCIADRKDESRLASHYLTSLKADGWEWRGRHRNFILKRWKGPGSWYYEQCV